jgi:hypothetical protein
LILALVVVLCLAIVPAASATTVGIFVGTSQVGTAALTDSGTCGSMTIPGGDVCLSVAMTGGNQLRLGGDVIGLKGNVNVGGSTAIAFDSSGVLSVASHPCNANLGGSAALCITAGSGMDISTLELLLTHADITSGITIVGFHVIGTVCGGSATNPESCFATTSATVPPVPEPSTLGLLGTGLIVIAGLVYRFRRTSNH